MLGSSAETRLFIPQLLLPGSLQQLQVFPTVPSLSWSPSHLSYVKTSTTWMTLIQSSTLSTKYNLGHIGSTTSVCWVSENIFQNISSYWCWFLHPHWWFFNCICPTLNIPVKMVLHAFNPSYWEAEAGGACEFKHQNPNSNIKWLIWSL